MAFCLKKPPHFPPTTSPSSILKFKPMSTTCSTSDLLLNRHWMLPTPASQIHKISLSDSPLSSFFRNPDPILPPRIEQCDAKSFYIVRDDLLHPLINGNKARKLDAVLPLLRQHSITDAVTCGGCQSAHAAALAVSCAERGLRAHLLLRGEQPEVPTGYNLVSLMYGNVEYVDRTKYARREEMLNDYADALVRNGGHIVRSDDIVALGSETNVVRRHGSEKGSRRVVIVNEGAGDAVALLGLIRLVKYLSQDHVFGKEQAINFVVDAGTGTTAIGLALGALYLGLPWKVTAIMLADTIERYMDKEKCLISDFRRVHQSESLSRSGGTGENIVHWVERVHPRKFGKVLEGEIQMCKKISQQTGILLDPIYTLAAWEQSILSLSEAEKDNQVVMLHTGGTLGLFGLAQRYASHFYGREQASDNLL